MVGGLQQPENLGNQDVCSVADKTAMVGLDDSMNRGGCWGQFGIPCCLINAPQWSQWLCYDSSDRISKKSSVKRSGPV